MIHLLLMTLADKTTLFNQCKNMLEARMAEMEKAMADAQESANSEDKSSAGDKYETGRAMSQIARDMSAKQLFQAQQDYKELMQLWPLHTHTSAQKGSLIGLNNGQTIFIATSIGLIDALQQKVAVVSIKAPIALQLIGKRKGDEVIIAQKKVKLTAII